MFLHTVSFAHQAFEAVTVHSVMETLLGHHHGKLHRNTVRLLGQTIVTFYGKGIYRLVRIHHLLDGKGGFEMFAIREDLLIFYGLHILSGMRPAHL